MEKKDKYRKHMSCCCLIRPHTWYVINPMNSRKKTIVDGDRHKTGLVTSNKSYKNMDIFKYINLH